MIKLFITKVLTMNNKGFTLIEQLVVVLILSILSGIAVPNLLGQKYQSDLRNDYNRIYFGINEALANANRQSRDVTITIPTTGTVTAILVPDPVKNIPSKNALSETLTLNSKTQISSALTVTYNVYGVKTTNPNNDDLVIIGSSAINDKYCIVLGPYLIGRGIYDGTKCNNNENLQYDNNI